MSIQMLRRFVRQGFGQISIRLCAPETQGINIRLLALVGAGAGLAGGFQIDHL